MNYKLLLIFAFIAVAVMPLAHAFVLIPSAQQLIAAFVTIILAMTAEVGVVIFFLRKKSLKLIKLSGALFEVNIISLFVVIFIQGILFVFQPLVQIFLSATLVVLLEAYLLAGVTKGSYFREPEGIPIEFKGALIPVLIGNVVSIVVGMCTLFILAQHPIEWPLSTSTALPPWIEGQGTCEITLEARDLDGDASTLEAYYDTVLDITWLPSR